MVTHPCYSGPVAAQYSLVGSQDGGGFFTSWLLGSRERGKMGENGGLGSQCLLQGYAFSDLTSFHWAPHPKASTTSQ